MAIDTDITSEYYRRRLIDPENRRLLITNFRGSEQEEDLTEPANCAGFGRIRHFSRRTAPGWLPNPIPIDPAAKALGLGEVNELRAQVFQSAGCNWRCWYCFVPFKLLSANPQYSRWLSVSEMVTLFLGEKDRPSVIDLSGGEPELTPEWVPWMLEELRDRGLGQEVYVWSDDNLSTDYFWKHLTPSEQEAVGSSPNYGRVGCFKGFDEESFGYNTGAVTSHYWRQFEFMRRLLETGIDVYSYVTLTCPSIRDMDDRMSRFLDRLQEIDVNLPLRMVPLEIRLYTPVRGRLAAIHEAALENQWRALEAWQRGLEDRFSVTLRAKPITEIPLHGRG